METALWTALAVMLGVGAKGASVGEIPMPANQQIELLRKAKEELEKKVRDLEVQSKENTIEAKKSFLYEQKQESEKSKREIAEAEAIWSRATPEVLERFARQRMKKEGSPDAPGVETEAVPETPAVETDVAPEMPEVETEAAPEMPEVETEAAPEMPEVETDVAPEMPEVETDVAPETPAVETEAVPEPPSAATSEPGTPGASLDDLRASKEALGKQDGGAQGDVDLSTEVEEINHIYQTLAESSVARAYVVRGSLQAFYGKLKKAWTKAKNGEALPPALKQTAFLDGVKEELLAIAEGRAVEKKTARQQAEQIATAAKEARGQADAAVRAAKEALAKGSALRNWLNTTPKRKLGDQATTLRGFVALGGVSQTVSEAAVTAGVLIKTAEKLVTQFNTLEVQIEEDRSALQKTRAKATSNEDLPTHLAKTTGALEQSVEMMTAVVADMESTKAEIETAIKTNVGLLKRVPASDADVAAAKAEVDAATPAAPGAEPLPEPAVQPVPDRRGRMLLRLQTAPVVEPVPEPGVEPVVEPVVEPGTAPAPRPDITGTFYSKERTAPPTQSDSINKGVRKDVPRQRTRVDDMLKRLRTERQTLSTAIGTLAETPDAYIGGCGVTRILGPDVLELLDGQIKALTEDRTRLDSAFKAFKTTVGDDFVDNSSFELTGPEKAAEQRKKEQLEAEAKEREEVFADVKKALEEEAAKEAAVAATKAANKAAYTKKQAEEAERRDQEAEDNFAALTRQKLEATTKALQKATEAKRKETAAAAVQGGAFASFIKVLADVHDAGAQASADLDRAKEIVDRAERLKTTIKKVRASPVTTDAQRRLEAQGCEAILAQRARATQTVVESRPLPGPPSTPPPPLPLPTPTPETLDLPGENTFVGPVNPFLAAKVRRKTPQPVAVAAPPTPPEPVVAPPPVSLQSKTIDELKAMRTALDSEISTLNEVVHGPEGRWAYAPGRNAEADAAEAQRKILTAQRTAIHSELKTRPEYIKARLEAKRASLETARADLERVTKEIEDLNRQNPTGDQSIYLANAPAVEAREARQRALRWTIQALDDELTKANTPPLEQLQVESPETPLPAIQPIVGDLGGIEIRTPPTAAELQAALNTLPLPPDGTTEGTELEPVAARVNPELKRQASDLYTRVKWTKSKGEVDTAPIYKSKALLIRLARAWWDTFKTLPPAETRTPEAQAEKKAAEEMVEMVALKPKAPETPPTGGADDPVRQEASKLLKEIQSTGGSRKSTFKRRRGGKQNGRGTRRRKNRANRSHSHAR